MTLVIAWRRRQEIISTGQGRASSNYKKPFLHWSFSFFNSFQKRVFQKFQKQ